MTRALTRSLAVLALCGASACSFEAPEAEGALSTNTCSYNEDCAADSMCNGSMCVARTVNDSLRLRLHVTPLQQPDGALPVAITSSMFSVDRGSDTFSWPLPEPVRVRGKVRNLGAIVDADVTLTATETLPGLPSTAVMVSVAGGIGKEELEHDFDIRVPDKGEYVWRVQPKDTSLPPYEEVVDVARGTVLEVKYEDHAFERTIALRSATDGRKLIVRAFDPVTGALISSTAEVMSSAEQDEALATLRFATEPEEFRLVVRAEDAYDSDGLSNEGDCDHDTPVLPTFSISSRALAVDDDGVLQIELPEAPERVQFKGWVNTCEASPLDGASEPMTLPMTLRSTAVALGEADGMWTAEVATDTEARRDGSSRKYEFCVDVFQGTYEIVVTPPESKPCELFAEGNIPISAQDGEAMQGLSFDMVGAAQLRGALSAGMVPLVSTTVDVHSLGRALELDGDATLTVFNRSRQTTTDETGAFRVPVDRGSYDVTIKPPSGSGYAWYVRRDVEIGSNEPFTNNVDMSSPVAVECDISYPGGLDGDSVAGAEVTAYAVITDPLLGDRAIAIGTATADENGQFMLLLPSAIPTGWAEAGVTQ